MHATLWMGTMLSVATLFASGRIDVSICNLGHLSEAAVAKAEAEATAVFHSMGVEVVWAKCGAGPVSDDAVQQHWYTIRLRGDQPAPEPGPASLELLGRAFVSRGRPGYLADVYFARVRTLARRSEMDAAVVIGCVMAHELGHLLLGPGHVPDGIMQAAWSTKEMEAMRRRWLRFNCAEYARIRQTLHQ